MSEKKSFIVYREWGELFGELSDRDAGKLIKALFSYVSTGKIPEISGAVKMAFLMMRNTVERDTEKYETICRKNEEKARNRWNEKNTGKCSGINRYASECSGINPDAGNADNENENDNDNENVNVNVNDNVSERDNDSDNERIRAKGCADAQSRAQHCGAEGIVKMTVGEYTSLCEQFGKSNTDEYIERCESYCIEKRRRYRNYARTLRDWMKRDGKDKEAYLDDYRQFINNFDILPKN